MDQLFWCERGDLVLSQCAHWEIKYSPVCALAHAQPTGLCVHDSSLIPANTKKEPVQTD